MSAQLPATMRERERIEAEAAVWISLRDRGMTEWETTRFVQWFQQDRRHAEVFNALDLTWSKFNQLGDAGAPTTAEMPRAARVTRRPLWQAGAGIAAAVALAFAGWWSVGRGAAVETAVGGFQRMDLPDGSVLQLNTDTVVKVRYSESQRSVTLARGEAHFTVVKDTARPFEVAVGEVAVRAVGTAFNIRLRDDAVDVIVTEGKVQVTASRSGQSLLGATHAAGERSLLVAGERAVIPAARDIAREAVAVRIVGVSETEIERVLAWQERRLQFDATPLAEVVAEFNRYNRHKLVIDDPRLAAQLFGGTFRADGYDALVGLLESSFGVTAERHGDRTLLRAMP